MYKSRNIIGLLLIAGLTINVQAQVSTISNNSLKNIQLADMNSDGMQDLIGTYAGGSGHTVFFPRISNGEFGQAIVIIPSSLFFVDGGFAIGDLDNDGDNDLVAHTASSVSVYLNTDGAGSFNYSFTNSITMTDSWLPDGIAQQELCLPFDPVLSDRNNDGQLDLDFMVIRCRYFDPPNSETIRFTLYGDGTGGFQSFYDFGYVYPPTNLPEIVTNTRAVDMNNDGKSEVVAQIEVQSFPVHSALYSYPQSQDLNYYLSTPQKQYQFRDRDVNDDGEKDFVVLREQSNSSNKFVWYENDGNTIFSSEELLIDDFQECTDFDMDDLDGDGDLDIAGLSESGELVIYKNEGNGSYNLLTGLSLPYLDYSEILLVERLDGIRSDIICAGGSSELYTFQCLAGAFPPPVDLNVTMNPNSVTLNWAPVPLSVACRIQGGPIGGTPTTIDIVEPTPNSYTLPMGALQADVSYEWRVRCACDVNPMIAGPNSSYSTFTVPPNIQHDDGNEVKAFGDSGSELLVFPNPSNGTFRIHHLLSAANAKVFSVSGDFVRELDVQSELLSIDLEAGSYLIVLFDDLGKKISSSPLLIQK